MEIKTGESRPSRTALWIGTLTMSLSLATLLFIEMASNHLYKIVSPIQMDLLWNTKVLLSVGGFIGSFWYIPCATIMVYFWCWVCWKSSRLMIFSAIYSLCLIIAIEFTVRTYTEQKRIIQESLNSR